MDVDIRFFQAAATAIPTLFIAMAVSAKIFHPDDGGPGNMFAPRNLLEVGFSYFALVSFAATEMMALGVLAFNTPNLFYAGWAAFIIWTQLIYLVMGTTSIAADEFRPTDLVQRWTTGVVAILGFLIPAGIFVIMALVAPLG